MTNIVNMFETAAQIIKSFTDDEKPPLHVGEVMSCWMYLAFVEQIIVYEEVALNTTTDKELKESFEEAKQIATAHQQELTQFLKQEGVPMPELADPKPMSEANAIPLGAKFTDDQLVNALSINLAIAATTCAQAATQSIRNDVGAMFIKFQMHKMTFGAKIKQLMKKRGWLKTPPAYLPPGRPD